MPPTHPFSQSVSIDCSPYGSIKWAPLKIELFWHLLKLSKTRTGRGEVLSKTKKNRLLVIFFEAWARTLWGWFWLESARTHTHTHRVFILSLNCYILKISPTAQNLTSLNSVSVSSQWRTGTWQPTFLCLWALGSLPTLTLPSVSVLKGLHAGGWAVSVITLCTFRGAKEEREREREREIHVPSYL